MKSSQDLSRILEKIDGRGYKAYKEITGAYDFHDFILFIDHAQGDPFAAPSRVRIRVGRQESGIGKESTLNKSREVACRDFLSRIFFQNAEKISKGGRGLGNSGLITITRPSQEILERSSMVICDEFVEARIFMGLPARGRRISGKDARSMFFKEIPEIAASSLFFRKINQGDFWNHLKIAEDADCLREMLDGLGLVGFVADGSRLPRASGIDPAPLVSDHVVEFMAPESLAFELDLPNRGKVRGLGLPRGVTLIVGGGYHGKSTLLDALELGVYNHIPGDGRELAVTCAGAVKIRSADGRNIEKTDISPFISNLPLGKCTTTFSTSNASGSTSQAAAISEALEAGATALLLDEDTSATNFMIRDARMQKLVEKRNEPITPFIDKVRHLYMEKGVSSILVMGGSGDYFPVADHVILMREYLAEDVTREAHEIAKSIITGRVEEGGGRFGLIRERIPLAKGFDPFVRHDRLKVAARGLREIVFGNDIIDCWDLEQIVEASQTRAIGYAIYRAMKYIDEKSSLAGVLGLVMEDIRRDGLDILPQWVSGDLSMFRIFELAAAINRMRRLAMGK